MKSRNGRKKEEIGDLEGAVNGLCFFFLHQDRDAFVVSSAPSPSGEEYPRQYIAETIIIYYPYCRKCINQWQF